MKRDNRTAVLIAAAITAVLVALFRPNFLTALNRSRQKKTMADLRKWGGALDGVVSRHGRIPSTAADTAAFAKAAHLPLSDGWGHELRVAPFHGTYMVQSAARDGRFDVIDSSREIRTFDDDLVYAGGSFLRWAPGF